MLKKKDLVFSLAAFLFVFLVSAPPISAQAKDQPVVVKSRNSFSDTVSKLKQAIQEKGMMVVFEANHKNMLAMIGQQSKESVTIGFGRPQMGGMLFGAEPKAALEMPLRVAVRELDNGDVLVLYYKPSYLFAHYRNKKLDSLAKEMDTMVTSLVSAATQ